MTGKGVLDDVSFCHLVVGVTDMDRALAFYRDVLGMEVVFETLISGSPSTRYCMRPVSRKAGSSAGCWAG
ncbi:hypothetical protein A5659_14340 [Mycobacterium sp. 1165196.3]|uniref:VOC family protein n=1 Tax=Mycobacterium sp. 1165196.3 TaxID=1834071 RepID=UPI0007FD1189|nr:VOC family protein [Mycobacterium sp. 1165196.3]OBK38540.1 hypothetical protein A5659_14340 [Mycobacterium sp. 1165196.3]